MTPNRMITVAELSILLDVRPATILRWRRKGWFPRDLTLDYIHKHTQFFIERVALLKQRDTERAKEA